ncbi:MAG: thymidine phosphorylase [Clostridia bacterium]|nr:thymidine phosphorylase [Clostridia bacterium]
MNITEIINKKKHGSSLTDDEIYYVITNYISGEVTDYHMSALAMAIFFQGMDDKETATLTNVMAQSGDQLDLSEFGNLTVDKHSTGGVGDKTSLIVAPIVASLGAKVAKMSGRGLGHTGGTIDKLESIPGYNTSLDFESFLDTVRTTGIALVGSSKNLAPADKKLYALRDVTATVDSLPLIASSVMSKKIAAGAKNIVIDVKCGSGAFMKTADDAVKLAKTVVSIGKMCGRNISAMITDMDTPLGYAIGNSLEVFEAIDILKGKGPEDLKKICIKLSSEMLSLVFGGDWEERVIKSLDSGNALDTFYTWIKAQGGQLEKMCCNAEHHYEIVAQTDGFISSMNAELIGKAAMILGAGRTKVTDSIDHSAGIILKRKTGDFLSKGDVIAELITNKRNTLKHAEIAFNEAFQISDHYQSDKKLIYDIIR